MDANFAALTVPLEGEGGCGPDVRYTPEYEAIRAARARLYDHLPTGMWARVTGAAGGWNAQLERCSALLQNVSRDIQVFGWWVEALYREQGLTGLTTGTETCVEAVITLWSTIHPCIEPDGNTELREGPLRWLMERWAVWTGELPAADSSTAADWARLEVAVRKLVAFLKAMLPEHELHSHGLLAVLAARQWRELALPAVTPPPGQAEALAAGGASPAGWASGGPSSRDQAYEQIARVAEFLARTEPHSPAALILRSLVQWRDCSFAELLGQLPFDGPTVYDLLRIFPRGETSTQP